jgi:uncharacterized membrane protein
MRDGDAFLVREPDAAAGSELLAFLEPTAVAQQVALVASVPVGLVMATRPGDLDPAPPDWHYLHRKYGWFLRLTMKRISKRAGHTTDTTRDHVFTDYVAVAAFADRIAERLVRCKAVLVTVPGPGRERARSCPAGSEPSDST